MSESNLPQVVPPALVPALPPGGTHSEQVRRALHVRKVIGEVADWETGLLLVQAKQEGLWRSWARSDGVVYSDFDAFVGEELGYSSHKATVLMGCAQAYLVDLRVEPQTLLGLGLWHAEAMRKIVAADTVEGWLAYGKTVNLATVQKAVRDTVARLEAGTPNEGTEEPGEEGETSTPSSAAPDPDEAKRVRRVGCILEDAQLDSYEAALRLAAQLSGRESQAGNLSAICIEFVAANAPPLTEIGLRRETIRKQLGDLWGGTLVFTPTPVDPVPADEPE